MSAAPTARRGRADLRHVVSADGTELVLEKVTDGAQDLLLVPGGPNTRHRWAAVAELLGGRFSCWLMDRRGKGGSGDTAPYSLDREYDDLAAAVDALTGPVAVAAHSSGALCALGAAARGVPFASLVLYEPPYPVDGPLVAPDLIAEIERLVDDGDRDGALELAFREVVGMPPPAVTALAGTPLWAESRALVHTWPREMREVERLPHGVAHLAAVTTPALLLHGALTPPHLARSTVAIADALPASTLVELPGQAHGALVTAPDLVAEAMHDFARDPQPPADRPRPAPGR